MAINNKIQCIYSHIEYSFYMTLSGHFYDFYNVLLYNMYEYLFRKNIKIPIKRDIKENLFPIMIYYIML
jgi:hypothetical protein